MKQYEIQFAASAAKEFRALPVNIKQRMRPRIDALRENPHPTGARKLQGREHVYRIRVGDYRIVYEIESVPLIVRIVRVRHRRDVYR